MRWCLHSTSLRISMILAISSHLVNIAVEEDDRSGTGGNYSSWNWSDFFWSPSKQGSVNLYRLMLGPDFSVYANEENPHGSGHERNLGSNRSYGPLWFEYTGRYFGEIVEPILEYEDNYQQASIMVVLEDAVVTAGALHSEDNRYIYWLDLANICLAIPGSRSNRRYGKQLSWVCGCVGIDSFRNNELPMWNWSNNNNRKLAVIRNGFNSLKVRGFEILIKIR